MVCAHLREPELRLESEVTWRADLLGDTLGAVFLCCRGAVCAAGEWFVCVAEEYTCLWQDCGFCSLESPADLVRHVYFHCYHTKLKQWGLRALQSQADVSHCQLDFQSRNIIPEIQENFLCLWEYCEVRAGGSVWRWKGRCCRAAAHLDSCTAACWLCLSLVEASGLALGSSPCPVCPCPAQRSFDNPEWFYRHVEDHSFCSEYKAAGKENHVVLCGWKGLWEPAELLLRALGWVANRGTGFRDPPPDIQKEVCAWFWR